MKHKRLLVIVGVLALSAVASPLLADNGAPPVFDDLTNIVAVLQVIQAGGLGATVSILLGKWVWFNGLESDELKSLIAGLAMVVPPLLAYGLLQLVPADTWANIQPYWQIIVTALSIGFPAQQLWFNRVVKAERVLERHEREFVMEVKGEDLPVQIIGEE